jgi:hypothetical protein
MSHHKTRKSISRSRHNKTRGGGKALGRRTPSHKEKRRTASTTHGSGFYSPLPPPKKKSNAKVHTPYDFVMPKNEWNALSVHQQRELQIYGTTGPNKE